MWCFSISGRVRLALGVALATHLFSSTALAYCRSKTCSLGKEEQVALAECKQRDGCISEGASLHWPTPCLRYSVQVDGSPLSGLDADQVADLVEQAFLLWKTAECDGGQHPHFETIFEGFVSCDQQETVCADRSRNVSVVMFHDDAWPYDPSALGITTPAAGTERGEMHDADVEINAQATSSGLFELFPVLAHEVGHYLGLAHSNVQGALMSVSYQSIGTSGELFTADDAAAICAIYPPSFQPLACAAHSPAYDACKNPDPDAPCSIKRVLHPPSGGCAVARVGTASPEKPLFAFCLGLGLAWLVRRRSLPTRTMR